MEEPRILIVDDDPQVRDLLTQLIARKFKAQVSSVSDGNQALELLRTGGFDLVLLDIKMPGLSGIDVIRLAGKSFPATKFIVVSAYDSQEVADEAIKAGAQDYILKSHSRQEIELKIKRVLGSG